MNSQFNKETSEGYYSFDQDEVFEALTMWCAKKGITLDKRIIHNYDASSTVDRDEHKSGFIVHFGFNHRKVG